jgi:hypothetical protein
MGSILKRALALFLIFSTEALGAYSPYTELQVSGSPIDPRQIRALTTADVISAAQSGGWSTGRTWTLGSGSDSVTALQGGAPWSVLGRPSDGTNSLSKLFDGDSGAGTEWNLGVILRQSASGGSIEVGTSTNPLQIGFASTPTVNLGTLNGAATATNQTSELTKLDTLDTDLKASQPRACTLAAETTKVIGTVNIASSQSVSISNFPSNQNVTLDGAKTTASVMPAGGSGSTGWLSAIANFLANTLTVSISGTPTVTSNQGGTWTVQPGNTANSTAWLMNIGQFGGTNVVTGTGAGGAGIPRVTVSNDSTVGIVNAAAVTKGTQGANGVPTQALIDSGRSTLNFYAAGIAAGTTGTETAITLTKSADTGATSSAASFVITSGKRFRIQQATFCARGNATATAQITKFNLRINTAGAVTTASTPVVLSRQVATEATASQWRCQDVVIPDGIEYAGNGTIQFGLTAAATFTTNAPTWDANIVGFEY